MRLWIVRFMAFLACMRWPVIDCVWLRKTRFLVIFVHQFIFMESKGCCSLHKQTFIEFGYSSIVLLLTNK